MGRPYCWPSLQRGSWPFRLYPFRPMRTALRPPVGFGRRSTSWIPYPAVRRVTRRRKRLRGVRARRWGWSPREFSESEPTGVHAEHAGDPNDRGEFGPCTLHPTSHAGLIERRPVHRLPYHSPDLSLLRYAPGTARVGQRRIKETFRKPFVDRRLRLFSRAARTFHYICLLTKGVRRILSHSSRLLYVGCTGVT
jgi:hypothetical protein